MSVAAPDEWGFDAARLLERVGHVIEQARLVHGDDAWAAAVDDVLDGDRSSLEEASSTQSSLANTVNALKKRTVDDVIDARPLVQKAIGEPCSAASYAEALAGEQLEIVDSLGDHVFAASKSSKPRTPRLCKRSSKNCNATSRSRRSTVPSSSALMNNGWIYVAVLLRDRSMHQKQEGSTRPTRMGSLRLTSGFRRRILPCRLWWRSSRLVEGPTVSTRTLYADGKVCLCLYWGRGRLRTSLEKWDPSTGSLRQILLSIQHQILVAEPYFNEPGRDVARGTSAGKEGFRGAQSKS